MNRSRTILASGRHLPSSQVDYRAGGIPRRRGATDACGGMSPGYRVAISLAWTRRTHAEGCPHSAHASLAGHVPMSSLPRRLLESSESTAVRDVCRVEQGVHGFQLPGVAPTPQDKAGGVVIREPHVAVGIAGPTRVETRSHLRHASAAG